MMWGGGLFALICVALMIWMMMGHGMMGRGGREHGGSDHAERGPDARQILAERLARGEISEQEFERLKGVLEHSDS